MSVVGFLWISFFFFYIVFVMFSLSPRDATNISTAQMC